MPKLFVFDMDGTILNNKGQIQKATLEQLKIAKDKGHFTAIATGRPLVDSLRPSNIKNHIDYFICNNGAYHYNVKEKEIHFNGFVPINVIKRLIELGTKIHAFFALHTDKGVHRAPLQNPKLPIKELEAEIRNEWHKFKFTSLKEIDFMIQSENITQASIGAPAKEIQDVYNIMSKEFPDVAVHIANAIYLDINPKNISKLFGIEKVLEEINIKMDDTIAFGDSGNDIQMLQGVSWGIAMGNSYPSALEVADEIIGDNNTNAIAEKMKELLV